MSQARSITIALLTVGCMAMGSIAADTMPTSHELIDAISAEEGRLKYTTAEYEFRNDADGLLRQGTWWFSHDGRQKYDSALTQVDPTTKVESYVYSIKAFDGQTMRVFFKGQGDPFGTGRVAALEPGMFCNPFLPSTLLGYGFDVNKGTFLSDVLRDAKQVTVQTQMMTLNGHTCYVVDAVGAVVDKESGEQYDMRVWLDPQRNMRPVQIDRYFGLAGENQWRVLRSRMTITNMAEVDGVWFPIEAKREWHFVKEIRRPEGMTDAETQSLREQGIDAWQSKMIFVTRPDAVETLHIRRDSLTVNEEIPQDEFTFSFPNGTRVYDQFLQTGYYVGGRIAGGIDELPETERTETLNGAKEPNRAPGYQNEDFVGNMSKASDRSPATGGSAPPGHAHTQNTWIMGIAALVIAIIIGAIVIATRWRRKSRSV